MSELQDELRQWWMSLPNDKEAPERLERLLRRVELEAYMAGEHSFAPYTDGAADERILAALRDERSENDGD